MLLPAINHQRLSASHRETAAAFAPHSARPSSRMREIVILVAVWTVPALFMVLQMYATAAINETSLPSARALLPAMAEWLIWVPLTPAIMRLARRFPVRWPPSHSRKRGRNRRHRPRLRALKSVRVEETGGEYMVSTITRADALPKLIVQTLTTLRSKNDTAMRRTMSQAVPMRSGRFTSTTVANHGAAAAVRSAALIAAATFDGMTATEELRLSPESVLLTALDASDVRLARDTMLALVRHRVISFTIESAPVRLFIDATSHIPTNGNAQRRTVS